MKKKTILIIGIAIVLLISSIIIINDKTLEMKAKKFYINTFTDMELIEIGDKQVIKTDNNLSLDIEKDSKTIFNITSSTS
ncbi:unnamed protein product, partial [marine sediment metagenome]